VVVGLEVGVWVGIAVSFGYDDGFEVGLLVGVVVGLEVSLWVGIALSVGHDDGFEVGLLVGVVVGLEVGLWVGISLSVGFDDDGLGEGLIDGAVTGGLVKHSKSMLFITITVFFSKSIRISPSTKDKLNFRESSVVESTNLSFRNKSVSVLS